MGGFNKKVWCSRMLLRRVKSIDIAFCLNDISWPWLKIQQKHKTYLLERKFKYSLFYLHFIKYNTYQGFVQTKLPIKTFFITHDTITLHFLLDFDMAAISWLAQSNTILTWKVKKHLNKWIKNVQWVMFSKTYFPNSYAQCLTLNIEIIVNIVETFQKFLNHSDIH